MRLLKWCLVKEAFHADDANSQHTYSAVIVVHMARLLVYTHTSPPLFFLSIAGSTYLRYAVACVWGELSAERRPMNTGSQDEVSLMRDVCQLM